MPFITSSVYDLSLKAIHTTKIILPEPPIILDRWGRIINRTTVGPMEEGDEIILTCRVVGGRPQPQVSWFMNGILVDEEYEHNSGNVIENRLLWPSLQRHDLYSVFMCRASNTKAVAPKERRLVLDMNCEYTCYKFVIHVFVVFSMNVKT
ncbi:unnamed protein product [Diamesa serratosioi]